MVDPFGGNVVLTRAYGPGVVGIAGNDERVIAARAAASRQCDAPARGSGETLELDAGCANIYRMCNLFGHASFETIISGKTNNKFDCQNHKIKKLENN